MLPCCLIVKPLVLFADHKTSAETKVASPDEEGQAISTDWHVHNFHDSRAFHFGSLMRWKLPDVSQDVC